MLFIFKKLNKIIKTKLFFILAFFLFSCSSKKEQENDYRTTEAPPSEELQAVQKEQSGQSETLSSKAEEETVFSDEAIPFIIKTEFGPRYGLVSSNLKVLVPAKYTSHAYGNFRNYIAMEYTSYGYSYVAIFDSHGNEVWTSPPDASGCDWITPELCLVKINKDNNRLIELPSCKETDIPSSLSFYDYTCVRYTDEKAEPPLSVVKPDKEHWDCAYYSAEGEKELDLSFTAEHLLPMVNKAAVVVTSDFDQIGRAHV